MRDQRLIKFARAMRSEPTPFEATLWYHLRAKRFASAGFRRQKVIGPYIVDFSCRRPRMLVIEIDGDTHGDRREYDELRTAYLEGLGYRVLRFSNSEIATNLHSVLTTIETSLNDPLSPTLSPEGEREKGVP